MGISSFKVRLLVGVCLLLQLCAAHLCPNSNQYWSSESESCVSCSKCNTAEKPIVIRPCQGHVDTQCGVLSDLNIDWSWLTKKDNKKHTSFDKSHHKHTHSSDLDEVADLNKELEKKTHHVKKVHKHHDLLDDPDFLLDQVADRKVHHHEHLGESKHHSRPAFDPEDVEEYGENKHHKKHHISSESFLMDDDIKPKHHHVINDENDNVLDYIEELKHSGKKEDLEKEWNRWLAQSKTRLQHRKEDLIKTLRKEEKPENKKRSKEDRHNSDFDMFDEVDNRKKESDEALTDRVLNFHHRDSRPRKPLSQMDLKIFEELVNQEHKRQQKDNPTIDLLKLMKSGDGPNRLTHDLEHYKKHHKEDLSFPVDSFDYRSIVPTHRLFLGEPSTISEIMDQDFSDVKNEEGKFNKASSKFKVIPWEDSDSSEENRVKVGESVQFTAAERFVWDWQAVALTSAVAACLLFFAVVAVYSVLHARQWRRVKGNFNSDMEEMSARISLMHPPTLSNSAADGSNANHYLENLLAGKKLQEKKTNIYIQKPTTS